MAAKEAVVDFTNVKDQGQFNTKHQPPGDYRARVSNVVDAPSKKDSIPQWLFTIQVGSGTYPYYCKHQENQFWKVRNLLVAAGIAVPKKRIRVNPNMLVGKSIAVTLEDDEYEGRMKSVVAATFPLSELGGQADDEDDPSTDVDDDDEDEDEPTPPAKKKAAPVEEDDDDDDDDDEPAPPPVKKKAKPQPEPEEEDDDDDEDEEPAPKPKVKKKAKVEDDDLEELDIDDV